MIIRVIDIETCGLPPDNGQVVEVGTVDLMRVADADSTTQRPRFTWTRGRMWSSLVNPGRPIPPEASAVHHITDDMVKDAPTIDQVWPAAIAADSGLTPEIYAAHERKFEMACLPQLSVYKVICTRKVGATAWPDAPNHKNQTLRYMLRLKLKDPALAEPHRALGDAYVTAALLRVMLAMPDVTIEELLDISNNPVLLRHFNFGAHAMKPLKDVPTSYLSWIVDKSNFDDEDVLFTARHYLGASRKSSRSPV